MLKQARRHFENFIVLAMLLCTAGCTVNQHADYVIKSDYSVADPQFRRSIGSLLGPPVVGGNSITPLRNGDEIFPSMLSAIHAAKETINCETFIYWSGDVGKQFTDALCDRANAGVHVHIIIDAIGSVKMSPTYLDHLQKCGVQVVPYHPVSWYDFSQDARLNNRTHRKLLIIDGKVGFTGGVGIADDWSGHAQDADHWRDMHYRIEGPVVAQLQAAFLDNWIKTTGKVQHDARYFPPLETVGDIDAQVFKSGADGGAQSMELLFLMSIAGARHDVRIGNAYFIPDQLTIDALLDARHRGVRVQIIVPGAHQDQKDVGHASISLWGPLLKAGVEFYQYQPTMYHTKLLIIDDVWTSVGSSNMDNRSFRLNDEANLNVLSRPFAATMTRIFEDDINHSWPYSYEDFQKRSWWDRMQEGLVKLIQPLL